MTPLEKQELLESLARMPRPEYLDERKPAARRLGWPVNELDAATAELRPRSTDSQSGDSLSPPPPEPWDEEVDGSILLDEIRAFIRRFVVVTEHALVALTLWIIFTYLLDIVEHSPRLAITSPTYRCGKSLVLDVLSRLVFRALAMSNVSPAVLYRVIELEHPTLLLDEVDTMPSKSERGEEIRGILNSGHSRIGAFVGRAVKAGDDLAPKRFSTWTPIAFAAIGELPRTWADRSIAILMKRIRLGLRMEKLTRRNKAAQVQAAVLVRKIVRWTADYKADLEAATPTLPEALDPRAVDNWDPLCAIAQVAGGQWPEDAEKAAIELSKARLESADIGETLIADIEQIFDQRKASAKDGTDTDKISSQDLCSALHSMEGRPWGEWGRARKPISPIRLANLLRPFKIAPVTIWIAEKPTSKGYKREDFEDAFSRYAPYPPPPKQPPTDPPGDIEDVQGETAAKGANTYTTPISPDLKRQNVRTTGVVGGNSDFQNVRNLKPDVSKNTTSPYGEKEPGGLSESRQSFLFVATIIFVGRRQG
jgi:putative DNA primase/helicase